jgi:uncharacterized protein involved in exopolysaccharide biosynthesis
MENLMHNEFPISQSSPGLARILIESIFRFRRLFLWSFLVSTIAVLGFTFLMPKKYRSEMKLIMQTARSNAVISPDRSSSSILESVSEEQLNSELEILQSQDVISRVADPLWDPTLARTKSEADLRKHSKLLTAFTKHLLVDPVGKSDVMSLSFEASTAGEAQDTLNHLAAAYFEQHERLQRRSGASHFYEEQAARYENQWHAAVHDLVQFQNAHHLVTVQDTEEKLEKAMGDDEAALRINKTHLNEITAALSKAQAVIPEVPVRQQTQRRVEPSQLLMQQLKSQLVGLDNHRTELLTRYTPTNRLVTEVDKEILDTSNAIDIAGKEENHEDTTDINPTWQHLKTEIVENEVEHNSLEGGRQALEQELASIRSQLVTVQQLAPEFDQLRANSEQSEANYEAFLEKKDKANVEDELDAHKFLNVNILESPTLPYLPSRPKTLYNLLLGIPSAAFLSLFLVYLAETGRKTFARADEIETAMQKPVLATIPYLNDHSL